jgi:hypothetical protein
MRVSIHYRGKLIDIGDVKPICHELTQIAEKMDWPYSRLDEDWSKPTDARLEVDEKGAHILGYLSLKGIQLKVHPRCESLSINFHRMSLQP